MRLQALLCMTVFGLLIIQAVGLPIEKELLRVKRKDDMDEEGQRLHRRELRPNAAKENEEDEREFHRKRRFESVELEEKNDLETYPNKMAARSSRSSREDNDVTARGMERFLIRESKTKGIKQPAKISDETSGMESDISGSGFDSVSGSGLWISDSEAKEILSNNVHAKRSLENIVAALGAVPRDRIPKEESEHTAVSGSGLWENSASGDDLPKFFSAAASNSHFMEVGRFEPESANENDKTKQTNLVSDLAEEVPQGSKPQTEESPSKSEPSTKQKRSTDDHIQRRDILHQFFDQEKKQLIHRSRREKIDTDLEEKLTSFFKNLHSNQATNNEPETPHEPPPIPAVTSTKRKSKVIKKGRDVSGSQNNAEGLTGLSLVKRFYRDQNMEETGQRKRVYPDSVSLLKDAVSKPLEKESKKSTVTTVTNVIHYVEKESKSNDIKRSSAYEPRVVHQKELPKAHVTIIEEPAVYSKSEDKGMDSSDGGMNVEDEDETEPSIEIHERDIREDGYVGCYADQSPDRDLPLSVSVRNITPKTCRLACKEKDYAYAGLQYGYLCRCGNSYGKFSRLAEDQCRTPCRGDKTQICGGFFRDSVYATEGATEPTQGNFFHIESVSPLNTPIQSQAATPNYISQLTPNYQPYMAASPLPYSVPPVVQFPSMSQSPAYFAPEEPKIIYHSETPLPVKAIVKAAVVNVNPPFPPPRNYPSVFGRMDPVKKSRIPRPAKAKHQVPQPLPTPRNVVRQTHYLHKQHGKVPALKPKINLFGHLPTNPATQTFTGSIKLKQSWIDGLDKEETPEFKILSGNIEEALKKMFKKNQKFISAKVHGFSKGLVEHNPVTIKKVVAAFSLTFQKGSQGIEDKVTKSVKDTGKLFDMPVFKKSIEIQEYHEIPDSGPSIAKHKVEAKKGVKDVKRSNAPKPKTPYTLELFLMNGQKIRTKRSELNLPRTV